MEFIIRQTVDLARENPVLRYAQPLEYGDAGAHRWTVTIRRDGAAVDLGAMSAKCYVKRAAGDAERAQGVTSVTVMLDAEIDAQSGTVSCVFDASCYGGVGAAAAILRLSDAAGATVTAAKLIARLDRSTSDAVYDPENLVPSLDALLAQIETIEAATQSAEAAAAEATAAAEDARAAAQEANFVVLGQYDTLALLQAAHPAGGAGDAWFVGEAEPYDVHIWDVDKAAWKSIGPLQGAKGADGKDGTDGADGEDGGYYAPSVDSEGNLSWAASKAGMPDVPGASIRGPKGDSYVLTEADRENIADRIGQTIGTNVYATPEMYGAAGDGVTDDTQALQSAIDSGRDVLLVGRYKVGEVKLAPYVTMTGAPGGRIVDGKVMMCPYSSIVGVVFEATAANANGCIVDIGTYDAAGVADSGGDDRYTIRDVKVLTDYAVKSDLDFLYVHVGDGELAHLFGINVSNVSINGRLGKVFHFRAHLSAGNIVDDGNGVWVNTVNIEDVWCGVPEYIVYIDYADPDDLKAQLGTALRIGEMYLSHVTGEYSAYAKNDVYIGFPSTISATDVGFVDKGYTQDGGDPATAMYNIVQQPWYNTARTIIRTDCLGDRFFAYTGLVNQNIVCISGSYVVDEDTLYATFRHADGPYASMLRSCRTADAPAESNALTLNLVREADAPVFMGAGLSDRMVMRGRSEDEGPRLSLYLRSRPAIGYNDRVASLYSDLYMPYAVSVAQLGDTYVPVIGSMLFNSMSNRPMWYTGEKWVYADGTDADFS